MNRTLFKCCGFKIKRNILFLFFVGILFIHLWNPKSIIEGLTTSLPDQVLLGVGDDYKLYTYVDPNWNAITTPTKLSLSMLLAVSLGPDNKLYAVGNDNKLYDASGGGWIKLLQPTANTAIALGVWNTELALVGSDYKLYYYDINTTTVNPLPGATGPILSITTFKGNKLAAGKDHKLYRWLNNKWAIMDKDANIRYITALNDKLMAVGVNKKLYTYTGSSQSGTNTNNDNTAPGSNWTEVAGSKGKKLISIYGITREKYEEYKFE